MFKLSNAAMLEPLSFLGNTLNSLAENESKDRLFFPSNEKLFKAIEAFLSIYVLFFISLIEKLFIFNVLSIFMFSSMGEPV